MSKKYIGYVIAFILSFYVLKYYDITVESIFLCVIINGIIVFLMESFFNGENEMTTENNFNEYREACNLIEDLKNSWGEKLCELKAIKNINALDEITLNELIEFLNDNELEYNYEYSCYFSDLLNAVSQKICLLEYFEDICGEGITSDNIMWINRAIFDLIREEFGHQPLSYFKN